MALVVVNVGEVSILEVLMNKHAVFDMVIRLFSNNHTPAETDTFADYTEATFVGYVSLTLTGTDWTITPGNPTQAVATQQVFTAGGPGLPETIFGYTIERGNPGHPLLWAERFTNGPYDMLQAGDAIKITPKFTGE
jgi:hypothetical protein